MKALYVVPKTRKLSKRKESKIVVKRNDNAILHHNSIKLIGRCRFNQWLKAALFDKIQIPDLLEDDCSIKAEQTLDRLICAEARSKFPHLYPRLDVEAERMKSVLNALQYVKLTTPGDLNELAKEIVKAKDNAITYPLKQNFFMEPSIKELEYIRNEFNARKREASCPEYYAYAVARDAIDKIRKSHSTTLDLTKLTTDIPACTLSYHDVHFLKIATSLLPEVEAKSFATFYLERIERFKLEKVSSEDKYLSKSALEALDCERFLLWLITTFERKHDANSKNHVALLNSLYHYRNSVYHAEYSYRLNSEMVHYKDGEMELIAKQATNVLKVLYPEDYRYKIKALNTFANTNSAVEPKVYMCAFPNGMLNGAYRDNLRLLLEELRRQINVLDFPYSEFSHLKVTYWTLNRLLEVINRDIISNFSRVAVGEFAGEVLYTASKPTLFEYNAQEEKAFTKSLNELNAKSSIIEIALKTMDALKADAKVFTRACA